MMVHVAVIKTFQKFDAMSLEEKRSNYDSYITFLNKYCDSKKEELSDSSRQADKVWQTYYFKYTNKHGEEKQFHILISKYYGMFNHSFGYDY